MPNSTYLPHRMGRATIDPTGCFEAGSFQSSNLTCTEGWFGIDDIGSIKIVHPLTSDTGKTQFDDPGALKYITAEESNVGVLALRCNCKMKIHPWDKTFYIKMMRRFLPEGNRIVVRLVDGRPSSLDLDLHAITT